MTRLVGRLARSFGLAALFLATNQPDRVTARDLLRIIKFVCEEHYHDKEGETDNRAIHGA
jgi:hypothetical protein